AGRREPDQIRNEEHARRVERRQHAPAVQRLVAALDRHATTHEEDKGGEVERGVEGRVELVPAHVTTFRSRPSSRTTPACTRSRSRTRCAPTWASHRRR